MLLPWNERMSLEPRLQTFRQRFASDPLARLAEAYIALIALHQNNQDQAMAFARRVRQGPAGNTQDLGTLVEGATLARNNQPEAALALLDPLVGKVIDPFAQDLLHETAVTAAVNARRWYQAIVYINEWIHSTPRADLHAVRTRFEALLADFPADALESVLRSMSTARRDDIWERDLREAIVARMTSIAINRADAELARRILDSARDAVAVDSLDPLARLASFGGQAPRIVGARVGWITETSDALNRSRSAQAVAGSLEVFRPSRSFAPPDAQHPEDIPQLVVHDLSQGSRHDAMTALAFEGVSLVIGGYDATGASELAAYAESQSIAVILFVAPVPAPSQSQFTFVLGEPELAWASPGEAHAASQVDPSKAARIAAIHRQDPPADWPFTYGCEPKPWNPGESTYPVALWRERAIEAIAIDGPVECARRVLHDVQAARLTTKVLLGLEAREAAKAGSNHVLVATCGLLDGNDETMQAWKASYGGNPSWFQALGRDAAMLAHEAVAPQRRGSFTDMRDVTNLRTEALARLANARTTLWTTDAPGFEGQRVMTRKVHWVPNGGRSVER